MPRQNTVVSTGIPGLDTLLKGGLPKGRVYLVEGSPGVGKTTLGLKFLLEGAKAGERVMMVSLIETRDELVEVAHSHGWDLDQIHLLELPQKVKENVVSLQTVFPPGDVEFGEISNAIIEGIEQFKPDRLLIDSISQISMLTDSWQQMRSSLLKIRDAVHMLGCTCLFTSSKVERLGTEIDTIVHGSILLVMKIPDYGQISREIIIKKLRGHKYVTGFHNFRINTGGLEIFTWPKVNKKYRKNEWKVLSSGIQELDDLLGGGLEEGTACLITGSTGAGKSTLASLYVQAAAKRGQSSVIFCFDERRETFLRRSASLNMEMPHFIDQGLIDLRQVYTGEMSPGEFAQNVRSAVEETQSKVVLIDSVSGYMNSMPDDKLLMTQLHDLFSFLGGIGVLTLMVVTKYGASGNIESDVDASYLADTVVLLRHFEAFGMIRRCIAVIKKRHGKHEHTIREFRITSSGCHVGPPLTDFSGLLTGNPTYIGKTENLL